MHSGSYIIISLLYDTVSIMYGYVQTHAVLYKALKERMRPCLVLNKIDRLCLELQFTPLEAYQHLRRLIEATNALAATLIHSEFGEDYFNEGNQSNTSVGISAVNDAPVLEETDCTTNKSSNVSVPLVSDAARIQEEWTFLPEVYIFV